MSRENADATNDDDTAVSSEDILRTAWFIAAKHLTAGQKDVTKMIFEGILQERLRCFELVKSALGPDADRAIFVSHPEADRQPRAVARHLSGSNGSNRP